MFLFRQDQILQLREMLQAPGPGAVLVRGPKLMGKSTLVRQALSRRPSTWLQGSPLPAPLLAREHGARFAVGDGPDSPVDGWSGFSAGLRHHLDLGSLDGSVLVWDRADRLLRDPRWRQMLQEVWTELRLRARPVHLVFIVRAPPPPRALEFLAPRGSPLPEFRVGPLGLREATARIPGWSPARRIAAFSLLGGEPAVWDRVDPEVRFSTNLVRLFLEPGAPLRRFVDERFPVPGRNPERTLAIVHSLAHGAREWGDIKEAAMVFKTSSELGPYMKGLRDEGLKESRRSLDAAPGSRRRRHRLIPPLLASWHGLVRPRLAELDGGASPRRVWKETIRPGVDALVARRLPDLVADHLLRHGEENLHARARETGSLWGEGVDIPVAGILKNGGAVYGTTSWEDPGPDAVGALARQVAETRFGYGREARTLILFSARPVSWAVERSVARRGDAVLLGPRHLVGNHARSGE